ncbi:hypothetical protein FHR24_001754 [Wenyingzhuangia heitensis]|uniref:Uncharacterized protein n=1 Tax=Wenyingzhuangia heitensis TaxID=1487859 RepID=A0ABX0UDN5_9FLAO|nr:hypothetical protein [Wenyingzhuangia heitensis]NIJ45286.1 hypothetical protein [Wenyingzhuangia heitensis]
MKEDEFLLLRISRDKIADLYYVKYEKGISSNNYLHEEEKMLKLGFDPNEVESLNILKKYINN